MPVIQAGRRRHNPEVRRDEMSPTKRGFRSTTIHDETAKLIEEYRKEKGLPSLAGAIDHIFKKWKEAQG